MQFSRQLTLAVLLGVIFLLASAGLAAASGQGSPPSQRPENGEPIFVSKCMSCHTIGNGDLVGPDLKDVTLRRSPEWLAAFIANPQQLIDSGDKEAVQLVKDFNGVVMPAVGLSDAEVRAVIEYLKGPGGKMNIAESVPGNSVNGEKLFTGNTPLANGGTGCLACHAIAGTGALGGGALGPDLTHAFTKYGGVAGMGSALASLPFPTMQGIFTTRPLTPAEQADLLAFLQQADQSGQASSPAGGWLFLLLSVLGTSALFGVMLVFWPKQRQSLSERLRKRAR